MAPVSTIFQDDYDATHETQHVHAANKPQTRILDANYKAADPQEIMQCISTIDYIERKKVLGQLRKYEDLFDDTLGNFETSEVKLNVKKDAKPCHAKAFPVPKNHHNTLKHEIHRLVKLGVLKRCSDSEWAAPTFIIHNKSGTVRFISDFRKLNDMLKRKPYPIPKNAQMLQE
jgi:hypothetical protein